MDSWEIRRAILRWLDMAPTPSNAWPEKRREVAIRQAGFCVVRWDWATCWDGQGLAGMIRRALDPTSSPTNT